MKRLLVSLLLLTSFALCQSPQQLTIESIFAEGGLTGRAPETVKWSPDGTKVSFVVRDDSGEHGALYYVDVKTGKKAVLVAEEKLASLVPPVSSIKDEREKERIQRYSVAGYHWAPDSKHLLFDSKGSLWLYSLDTNTAVHLTGSGEASSDPKFSPNGKNVAFIRKHNLWLKPIADETEHQITNDKDENVLNGEVDWVYAEELDVRSNYFWSPEGKHIAFLQMNESKVPTYPIVDWIAPHATADQQKYPNAGDSNPEVRVGVVGSGGGKPRWIEVGKPEDREYIPRFGWVREGVLWIELLNREQNKLDLYFVDAGSGKSRRVLSETSDAWVPVTDMFQILASGDRFIWPSWRDGFMHLYLYSFDKRDPLAAEAKLERQLTTGKFEVDSVEAVDETAGEVLFVANATDLRERQLFAAKLDGSAPMRRISQGPGTHSISMADNAKYYVDTFSSATTPPRMSLCPMSAKCTIFWESRAVNAFNLPVPKRLELKAADNITTLYGTLLLPPDDLIAKNGGKAPLITNPYGGPGAQNVVDKWGSSNYLFDVILSRAGFAVLHVDNRGMAGRGKAFTSAVKGHVGDIELADQLSALDQVLAANPVLDRNRVGWWGWSYGGYMTTYALTHSDRFKAGIAVAPVTDWHFYDSIYTERYMGLPPDNKDGYEKSSALNSVRELSGRLLLVHGTGDDNVHVQNTVEMVESLINANKPYDLQLYPRKTHGIAGTAARVHLFHRIQDQFQRWLMDGNFQPATCAVSAPPQTPTSRPQSKAPRAQEECLAQGGRWGRVGLNPESVCNLPTRDGGKACTDYRQCEGTCIADSTASPTPNNPPGRCTAWKIVVGCLSIMQDGKPGPELCVD